jgi:di/tricarboxylate transporter
MSTFGLFSVTPIGIVLVAVGIIYFVLAGRYVLPAKKADEHTAGDSTVQYLQNDYGIKYDLNEIKVPAESPLVDKTLDEIERENRVRVIAIQSGTILRLSPGGIGGDTQVKAGDVLGVLASEYALRMFADTYKLGVGGEIEVLTAALTSTQAGIAELVIPPGSNLIGKSCRDVAMRNTYGLSVMAIHRLDTTIREGDGVRDMPLQAGDTLIGHVAWEQLARLEKDRNFVVVTTEYPHEELRPHKVQFALVFFVIALGMILFTDVRLSIALLTGAMGMVVTGVLKIDEAYEAVSWKTVFLLASLIPLGVAVETTGTAQWIAVQTLDLVGEDVSPIVLQAVVAVLATFFTLVMSNVGATVLLVPLAVNIAIQASAAGIEGVNPAVFALTVALATSNSFLIPTHQVNALIMGPGGYRVKDFMRAGGIMTILFLVVLILMLNVVF